MSFCVSRLNVDSCELALWGAMALPHNYANLVVALEVRAPTGFGLLVLLTTRKKIPVALKLSLHIGLKLELWPQLGKKKKTKNLKAYLPCVLS